MFDKLEQIIEAYSRKFDYAGKAVRLGIEDKSFITECCYCGRITASLRKSLCNSGNCRKKYYKATAPLQPCPRLDKKVYSSFEQALLYANEIGRYDYPVHPYRCVCGGIHLGGKR